MSQEGHSLSAMRVHGGSETTLKVVGKMTVELLGLTVQQWVGSYLGLYHNLPMTIISVMFLILAGEFLLQ